MLIEHWYQKDGDIARKATLRAVRDIEGKISYSVRIGAIYSRGFRTIADACRWLERNKFTKGTQ